MRVHDPKVKFYHAMLNGEADFDRSLNGYLKNPSSVTLAKRKKIGEDLNVFFDKINKDIAEAREEIAEFLRTTA
jgi:hypothetical protein